MSFHWSKVSRLFLDAVHISQLLGNRAANLQECGLKLTKCSVSEGEGTTTWPVETRGTDKVAWCSAGAASPEVKSKQTAGGFKAQGPFIIAIHQLAPAQCIAS